MSNSIAAITREFKELTESHDRTHQEQAAAMRALWHKDVDGLSDEQSWQFHKSAIAILERVIAE